MVTSMEGRIPPGEAKRLKIPSVEGSGMPVYKRPKSEQKSFGQAVKPMGLREKSAAQRAAEQEFRQLQEAKGNYGPQKNIARALTKKEMEILKKGGSIRP